MFILSSAAMLSAVSCEYDFELKDMPQEPVLCVECLPGLSDTTFVRVRVAVPVGNADVALPDVSGASVGFSVNGVAAEVHKYSCEDGIAVYYSLQEVACGDVLEMSASLEGVSPVSSNTVVPGTAPEFDVDMEVRNHDILMTVSVADNPGEDDFYAVTVVAKERTIDSTRDRESFYNGKFSLTDMDTYPDLSNSGVLHMDEFMSFLYLTTGIVQQTVCGAYTCRGIIPVMSGLTTARAENGDMVQSIWSGAADCLPRLTAISVRAMRWRTMIWHISAGLLAISHTPISQVDLVSLGVWHLILPAGLIIFEPYGSFSNPAERDCMLIEPCQSASF